MSKQLKISAAIIVFLLALYQLLRLGFLIANARFFAGVPAGDVLMAFVRGIRFDVAALLLLNGAILLAYNLPGNPARWKPLGIVLFVLCAANIAGIVLNLADYGYFPEAQRRLVSELSTMTGDIAGMVPGLVADFWHLFLLLVALAVLFVWLSRRYFRWLDGRIEYRFNILRDAASLVLLVALAVLGVRGGLQSKPLRPAHAFATTNWALGYLSLNTTYTVLRGTAQVRLPEFRQMTDSAAAAVVGQMVKAPNEEMLDPRYPFLRRRTTAPSPARRNLVVLILESWTTDQMGCYGAGTTRTPCFDSLAAAGLLFTNFLASGQRSIEAAPAILASLPGLTDHTQIGSTTETSRILGLGTILGRNGYATAFYHGAKTGSMGFDAFARMAGFTKYFGKEDYPGLSDEMQDGTWGLFDEPALLDACARAGRLPQPFCLAFYSLNPHVPYRIPAGREADIPRTAGETEHQRALRYADFSLGRFLAAARRQPWFPGTVFILVGDHTTSPSRSDYRSIFRVPCLVYAPGLVRPGRDDRIGSQVDLLPTALDLLGLSAVHAATGRSLRDASGDGFAACHYGGRYALFTDSLLALAEPGQPASLFDYRADPDLKRPLQARAPALATGLGERLMAYVQCAIGVLREDRVCPMGEPGSAARSPAAGK
ncbi:MAG: sulfatase-like hydrolase/transferase [Candidatus Edwardsbacteria bacterium]|nr:sulfatase-like hydrolase/transferase [Candidatus Edwardsbacteria bacterium]